MAKTIVKFTTVPYDVNGHTGYRPQLEPTAAISDMDFCEEVVKEKNLNMSAYELKHGVEALFEVGPQLVAKDARPRAITKLLKFAPFASGRLENANSTWDDATCKCKIRPVMLNDAEKEVDGSFQNTNDATVARLNYVTYLGAQNVQNVIMDDKEIGAYGNYMQFDASLGDSAALVYEDADGVEQSIALTCESSDIAHAVFAFPAALKRIEAGKTLTFKMVSRCGIEGNAPSTNTKKVTWLGSDDPVVTGESMDGTDNIARFGSAYTEDVTGVRLEGVAKVTAILEGASGNNKVDSTELTVVDATHLQVKFGTNSSDHPDGEWADKTTTWNFYDANGELVSTYAGVIWKTA